MSSKSHRPLSVHQLEDRTVPASVVLPESVFSVDQFETKLQERLDGNVVGYAYSIREHSANFPLNLFEERAGGNGYARTPADTGDGLGVAMTEFKANEVASVSKPITATAVMRLFQEQIGSMPEFSAGYIAALDEKLDQTMVDFLPADWEWTDPAIADITIRQLLRHESGLQVYGLTYDDARNAIANGTNDVDDAVMTELFPGDPYIGGDSYTTLNYTILREILPYMWGEVDHDILDGAAPASELPEYLQSSLESLFGVTDVDDLSRPQLTAGLYHYFVRTHVLAPAGIANPDTKPAGTDTDTLIYNFPDGGDAGESTGDQTLNAGGRGWRLSASQLQQFLTAVRFDNTLITPTVRLYAIDNRLGWGGGGGAFGLGWGHNGGNFGGADAEGDDSSSHRVNTRIMNYAAGVGASLIVNSQIGNGLPGVSTIMDEAYYAAWPVLVVEGDDGANTFVLRTNSSDSDLMDLEVDGERLLTMRKDVVTALTLRGLNGNDTFQVETLPATTHLTLDGGWGNDSFFIDLNEPGGVAGDVSVGGGVQSDSLVIDDRAGLPAVNAYTVAGNVFDWAGYAGVFQFDQLESLEVLGNNHVNAIAASGATGLNNLTIRGGGSGDTFTLDGVTGGVSIDLYGEGGADTFNLYGVDVDVDVDVWADLGLGLGGADRLNLGNGDLSKIKGPVEFFGGSGADSVVIDDSDAAVNRRVDMNANWVVADGGFGGLFHTDIESITHHGGTKVDRVTVASLSRGTTLGIFGYAGNDEFIVSELAGNVDGVVGTVIVHGDGGGTNDAFGVGNDILTVNDSKNLNKGTFNATATNAMVGVIEKPLAALPSGQGDRVRVQYDGIEHAGINAGTRDDTVNVESNPQQSMLTVNTGAGTNTVNVSPTARNLNTVFGVVTVNGQGTDTLNIDDTNSTYVGAYALNAGVLNRGAKNVWHTSSETLTLRTNNLGNPINVTASPVGSTTIVYGGTGNDTLTATAPLGFVNFVAGLGTDTLRLVGTAGADSFTVRGETMRLGTGVVGGGGVDRRELDGLGGTDSVRLAGVAGVNESFRIKPSQTPYAGEVQIAPHSPVRYTSLEEFRGDGNAADGDTLVVEGRTHSDLGTTNYADVFAIGLTADGTSADPLLSVRNAFGAEYLKLVDFTGLFSTTVDGLGGSDTFNVTINPQATSPVRSLFLNGGSNGAAGDKLNVYYTAPGVAWDSDEGGGSGTVTVAYGPRVYGLDISGMEDWDLILT